MSEERRTSMGLGNPLEPHDEDGEQVSDEELIGPSETDHPLPEPRHSSARISQRLPRLVLGGAPGVEGEVLVNRYRVERVVARTAHEIVLEASHLDLGQRVLLRHLTTLASTSPEAVARFQRGARKAREMRSEHAERVVDFGRLDSGAPYRAVELPRGPSLAEIVRVRGALPVAEAVDIVLTACEPLAEAHAGGVVHRSLGTSNIFVERRSDGSPLVRVLDFGVSDPLEPDWANSDELAPGAGAGVESLRFASPEQIRNPAAVDARSDVWALGAILYELIAGAPLFYADSPLTLLAMIAADTPTPLGLLRSDVPSDLEQLVLSCLEKDPEARPRSVVDVVLALTPYASADAQPAAARVARIVMRTTRPPPLQNQAPYSPTGAPPGRATTAPGRTSPGSSVAPGRNSRALVRSYPPARPIASMPPRADSRGFGMLFAGAAIGLGAALIAPRLAPPAPAPANVAAQPAPPVRIATAPQAALQPSAAEPLALPVAAPVTAALATATPAALPAPVPAPHLPPPITPVAAPRPVAAELAPRVAVPRPAPRVPARAPDTVARTAAASPPAKKTGSDAKPSADDLFGGLD